jgi:hypothetical protein
VSNEAPQSRDGLHFCVQTFVLFFGDWKSRPSRRPDRDKKNSKGMDLARLQSTKQNITN